MLGKNLTNEEKLDAIYQMTRENHEVLIVIRRQQYLAMIYRIFRLLVIVGIIFAAYYYVSPYIPTIISNTATVEEKYNELNQMKNNLPQAKIIDQVLQGMQKSGAPSSSSQ